MHTAGNRHDAADFALVLTVISFQCSVYLFLFVFDIIIVFNILKQFGKLHGLLPKSIPFTIVSGDKGFIEIIYQLKNSDRRINWFNPHQFSFENFNQILNLTST